MMEKKTTMQEERVKILSNTNIAKDTWRMELSADMAKDMKPGHGERKGHERDGNGL